MFWDEFGTASEASKVKVGFLQRNPIGYFIASMLAGAFIGFGVMLAYNIGAMLDGLPYGKIAMGLSFGIALSLVIMAGSELFTGNIFVLAAGVFKKKVTFGQTVRLLIVCYIGNWAGAVLLAVILCLSGFSSGPVGEFIASSAATKMNMPVLPLFFRGVLCNALVCLAIWCSYRCKSESGKLIMTSWCLFAFVTCGLEHSVANMTLLTISLFSPFDAAVSVFGYFNNLMIVTFANMIGGIFCVALPYHLISRR